MQFFCHLLSWQKILDGIIYGNMVCNTMLSGTLSYPEGNRNYPRPQVENEIEKHAKES